MFMFYLVLICASYDSSETKEPCEAQPIPTTGIPTMVYACDSNNDLQADLRIEINGRTVAESSYICKNGSWEFATQPKRNESCVAHPVQENTTTFYYCDYNNNVQSNFTSTSNLTYSLIPPETCVKGVWIITDQPSSNAPPATALRASVAQGKGHQQESSVTKLKPAVILMAIIFCFTLR